jgi:hypothetical protein
LQRGERREEAQLPRDIKKCRSCLMWVFFLELLCKKSVGNLDGGDQIKRIATIAGLTSQARILFPMPYIP